MKNEIIDEIFTGKYDGVASALHLAPGDISGGKNARKVSHKGGWKVRKGSTIHNTTALGVPSSINSLHQYKNPITGDYNFLAQCNSLLYEATVNPDGSTAGTTFGTSLGVAVGTTPGFSAKVGEYFFYADGSNRPLVWGGSAVQVIGFYVYDASETAYVSYSREAVDQRTDTEAIVLGAATDKIYILTQEPISGITFDLGASVNSNSVTIAVKAWRSGAWAAVSSASDGTAAGGVTLAVDGTVSWTAGSDEMRNIGKDMGYAYEIGWSGALSGSVTVRGVTVTQAAALMTNKWNGVFEWVAGAMFYDHSATEYQEVLGKITNESTSVYLDLSAAATDDFLYIKTLEPALGFGIAIPDGYGNTDAGNIDNIDYWNGSAWTTISTGIVDTTLNGAGTDSFSQTGRLFFDASAISPKRRTLQGDNQEGYWYRLSWDATMSADTRVYALFYAPFPSTLPVADGVAEFKGRLFTWGDKQYPNRLRYSSKVGPFCFSGTDSGYTASFGDMSKVTCAVKFYNELLVFKENGVYLLEGYSPATFGSLQLANTIGLASPKSVQVAEVGHPGIHQDEALSIALWQDVDGVYITDGRKPQKVSMPVDHYFNAEYTTCTAAASIKNRQSFVDKINNEYHLLLPTSELVYNFATGEWYPPWERDLDLVTGVLLKGTNGRDYTYGGTAGGFVMLLEADTTDKNASNVDVAITASIQTKGLFGKASIINEFDLRRIWAVVKGQSSGTLHIGVSKDLSSTFTEVTVPAAMDMTSSTDLTIDWVTAKAERINCFQAEFKIDGADEKLELWGMAYEIASRGVKIT